ncbi:subtilase family serine protease [Streptacidiphilus sp. BW17]|uniref:S53 family peptidase n=1 Tax=Streptacidiphilus sp. BW17 TaxID=3156274 RepID=UPI003513DBFF
MSYPPYGNGSAGNPPRPNNPYQNGPFPPQQQPQRGPQAQPPRPRQNPYGGQRPPQQPPNPYQQGPAAPPPPPPPYGGQPPFGGGPGGPGGPGRPGGPGQPPFGGGPGMPGGPGNSGGGGSRGSKKGVLIGIGVALVLVVGGTVAVAAGGRGGSGGSGGSGGTPVAGASSSSGPITTTSNGGTSWSPPSWATKANDVGPADPSTVVQGTVWIAKQHPQDLATYAAEVGMPGSPDYHKYLTPAQFNSTFVNVPDAATAVTQWLQQDGMTIVSQGADSVVVSTTLDKVESVLKVQIDKFKHGGRVDIAPTGQPQYPSDVGNYVSSVTGLTTSSPISSFAFKATAVSPKKKGKAVSAGGGKYTPGDSAGFSTQWCSTYWGEKHYNDAPPGLDGQTLPMQLCGYTPNQLRHAYGVAQSGLTGKGVTVAVVDAYASPTIAQDVANWNQQMGLPQFAPGQFTQEMPQGGFPPSTDPKMVASWQGEETMDIESVHLMAPDAKIVYYGTDGSDQGFDTALETIVANHTADIVSCSWGGAESSQAQEEFQAKTQIFEQGAAEGIGFNFASMDNGDYTVAATGSSDPNDVQPHASVAFPASDPFATGVGGTSLGIDSNGNYSWESGWGDWFQQDTGNGWAAGNPFIGGAGGGNSSVFPEPSYQKGVVSDSLVGAATGTANREVPDVGMDADWNSGLLIGVTQNGTINVDAGSGAGATFSESGGSYGDEEYGGTSLATPLFSGVEALAQQAAGGVPVGFVNPVLYKLSGSSAFHDVSGVPSALGHEPAMEAWNSSHNPVMIGMDSDTSLKTGPGYDDVTGVGTITSDFLTWFKDHPSGQ